MPQHAELEREFRWFDLDDDDGYRRWRGAKLGAAAAALAMDPVEIAALDAPGDSERSEIRRRCEAVNFARYAVADMSDSDRVPADLRRFAHAFGLRIAETHRSAGAEGIVALEPTDAPSKRGYIPYSTRGLNWHTDGYYNAPQDRISAFVLHCVRAAESGGENRILDPEILYIRLRDANPDHLRALMHPRAMSIPENREPDGSLRPVSVGPVFYPDAQTGRLQMRYTARTRSVDWRDDAATRAAEAWLRDWLARGDSLGCQIRLDAGQGILNNNVLHDRTGFERGDGLQRLLYRVRFHNRVGAP